MLSLRLNKKVHAKIVRATTIIKAITTAISMVMPENLEIETPTRKAKVSVKTGNIMKTYFLKFY